VAGFDPARTDVRLSRERLLPRAAMSWLQRWRWRRQGYLTGRPEEVWKDLIRKYAPGKSFIDIGCMWRVDGEYCIRAVRAGAKSVLGVDVNEATPEFFQKNQENGGKVRFIKGDLNDPSIEQWAGRHEVVFCSGVLYHLPNPIYSIFQMRKLCSELLILTSASVMEQSVPNSAVFLPGLDDQTRDNLNFQGGRRGAKWGLDAPIDRDRGYAPWFWLPTPSCIRSMVEAAGFEVREFFMHRRVTTLVGTPTREPVLPPL
jgi:hypothetical protein